MQRFGHRSLVPQLDRYQHLGDLQVDVNKYRARDGMFLAARGQDLASHINGQTRFSAPGKDVSADGQIQGLHGSCYLKHGSLVTGCLTTSSGSPAESQSCDGGFKGLSGLQDSSYNGY